MGLVFWQLCAVVNAVMWRMTRKDFTANSNSNKIGPQHTHTHTHNLKILVNILKPGLIRAQNSFYFMASASATVVRVWWYFCYKPRFSGAVMVPGWKPEVSACMHLFLPENELWYFTLALSSNFFNWAIIDIYLLNSFKKISQQQIHQLRHSEILWLPTFFKMDLLC